MSLLIITFVGTTCRQACVLAYETFPADPEEYATNETSEPYVPLSDHYAGVYEHPASHPGSFCGDGPCDCAAPTCPQISWVSGPYFKAGLAWALGEDLLEGDREAGYAISGGIRQPLGPDLGGDRCFFDVGGSYLSAFGETTRTTRGVQTTALGSVSSVALTSTLDEISRGSVHLAIGRFWGSAYDDRCSDPQTRVHTRFGGRLGSVRGHFTDRPVVAPPVGATVAPAYDQTDTFGGLFVSTEAVLLQRQFDFGQVQTTLEGEFANDWVDFEGFESGSLTTASLLIGFLFSR